MKNKEYEWNFVGKLGQYYILKNKRTFELMKTASVKRVHKLTGIEEF